MRTVASDRPITSAISTYVMPKKYFNVTTIAASLSEPRDAIEEIIEPYLIQQGFVNRTPRGRILTVHAFKHLGVATPETLASRQEELFRDDGE